MPVGVACVKCETPIQWWDQLDAARPCGHTFEEILLETAVVTVTVPRVRFGEYVTEAAE